MVRYGSVETGGTKFVLAIGDENFKIIKKLQIPTTTPDETIEGVIRFFKENPIDSLGIGSFGPIDINLNSSTYGYITTTPKAGWAQVNLLSRVKEVLNVPVAFTTDVNAAAYGEMIATGKQSLVYFTIGTGIGGGAVQDGKFVGGISHSEMGHTFVKRHPDDLDFTGICPFHGDCLEGLAAGPSIEARTGIRGEDLPYESPVWDIIAYYIAQMAVNTTLNFAPEKIVFGGGVMAQSHMMIRVQEQFLKLLNDYVQIPGLIDEYLVTPSIENNGSATIGGFAMAKELIKNSYN
ncbi:fructokinase ScrK [Lactovum miscens]|uniref:Fructokinase n=1 Tax=Lactovum miscens TaxID=190387 RepID=A0A841C991_9LACT|nr:fructokinase ScrK [Lactovum miscens]MBB5887780.1 fructokinase [Lactovum miscens]